MRFALLLFVVALQAEPMTFTFSGTWGSVPEPGTIQGVSLQVGDPFMGSFSFERLADNSVRGDLSFSLGGLVFLPTGFGESQPDGWGLMTGQVPDTLCHSDFQDIDVWCGVLVAFRGPRESGGGDGTKHHRLSLWAVDPNDEWSFGPLAVSRNVEISPYLPFAVRHQYFIPEPSTVTLFVTGLLLLACKARRHLRELGRRDSLDVN
jgi:hypothetical protein